MKRRLFLFVCLLLLARTPLAAQHVDLSSVARTHSEGIFEALIELTLAPNWHIFAPYDQEFGAPLKISLDLPPEAEILEESFSSPKNISQDGFSFDGYDTKAFYKVTLSSVPPLSLLRATLSWQACANDECYPETQTLEIKTTSPSLFEKKLEAAKPYFYASVSKSPLPKLLFGLLAAFFGGLILNLMPCIFPVLSLKLMSLLKQTSEKRREEGLFYFLGVVSSMLALASLLYLLRLSNPLIGWGFQMQSPFFVGIMLILFIILTLLMLDILSVNTVFFGRLASCNLQSSKANAFLTGLLAVIIASPCSAPFMGAAVGYALMAPPQIYFPIFLCLGTGYALPFVVLTSFPSASKKFLPKPGRWMETLKKILSLPLLATCLWLMWILAAQTGLIASGKNLRWQAYTPQAVSQALAQKRPVFIDFTARWCLTCLLNKQTSLQSDDLAVLAKNKNILLLRADATTHSKEIASALSFYGRSSVPLYVYYDGTSEKYEILPQILTPAILRDHLR